MTLTLASVYAPIGFTTGRTGKLFTEFALTLAGAVLVSGFVALTLSPMMCSQAAAPRTRSTALLYRVIESGIVRPDQRLPPGARARRCEARWLVVLVGAAGRRRRASSCSPRSSPSSRRSRTAARSSASASRPRARRSTTPTATPSRSRRCYAQVPEIRQYFVVTGFPVVSQVISFSRLKRLGGARRASQQDDRRRARAADVRHPGRARLRRSTRPRSARAPIDKPVAVRDPDLGSPTPSCRRMVDALLAEARKYPGPGQPRHRPQAEQAGAARSTSTATRSPTSALEVDTVGRTLETMLGGRQVTRFKRDGKQYDVIVQVADVDRTQPGRPRHDLRAQRATA